MQASESVHVYNFLVLDPAHIDEGGVRVSSYKATRQAIMSHYGGRLLEGTAQKVSVDELDAKGRYRRVATGWGELSAD